MGNLLIEVLLNINALGLDVVDGYHLYEEESGSLQMDLVWTNAV